MPNRVEELELTVSELESTVRGLTEELVETKERVRLLESVLEDADETVPTDEDSSPEAAAGDEGAEVVEDETPEAEPDDVAAAAAQAEADKDEQANSTDEDAGDSDLGDDIIVA